MGQNVGMLTGMRLVLSHCKMVSSVFCLFNLTEFISQAQCILINITVNMPELAKRLVFVCSPEPGLNLVT